MHLPAEAGGGTEDLGAADDDDVEVCLGRGAEDRWLAAERSCMSSGLRLTLAAVFSLPPNHSSAVSVASHSNLVGGNMSSCSIGNGSHSIEYSYLLVWMKISFVVVFWIFDFSCLKECRLDPGDGE